MNDDTRTPAVGPRQPTPGPMKDYTRTVQPLWTALGAMPDLRDTFPAYNAMRFAELMGKARDCFELARNCTDMRHAQAYVALGERHLDLADDYRTP